MKRKTASFTGMRSIFTGSPSIVQGGFNLDVENQHFAVGDTVPAGYEAITEFPRTDGYVLSMAHSAKGYSFAEKVGGASNKGYCDYYYTPADDSSFTAGWYGALLSASAYTGAAAGFGSLTANNRSSYATADLGFRLCRF